MKREDVEGGGERDNGEQEGKRGDRSRVELRKKNKKEREEGIDGKRKMEK